VTEKKTLPDTKKTLCDTKRKNSSHRKKHTGERKTMIPFIGGFVGGLSGEQR
jgi:hypothetical protein